MSEHDNENLSAEKELLPSPTSFNNINPDSISDQATSKIWKRFKVIVKYALDIEDFAELQYLTADQFYLLELPEDRSNRIAAGSIQRIKELMKEFQIPVTIGCKEGFESPNLKTLRFLKHLSIVSEPLLTDLGYTELSADLTIEKFEEDIKSLNRRGISTFSFGVNEIKEILIKRAKQLKSEGEQ